MLQYHHLQNSTMVALQQRMAILAVYNEKPLFLPVLAIIHNSYGAYATEKERLKVVPPSDMIPQGWRYEGQAYEYDYIVDWEARPVPLSSLTGDELDPHYLRTVVCHWPPEEDAARLQEKYEEHFAERVRMAARQKMVDKLPICIERNGLDAPLSSMC